MDNSARKTGETRRARCTLRRSGCARGCGRPRGDGGDGTESRGRERRPLRLGSSRRSCAVSARRGCVSAAGREAGDTAVMVKKEEEDITRFALRSFASFIKTLS
eukprot:scaffold1328_cov161-Pinguiococcus_pyrenoidosus.AAC.1